MTAPGIPPSPIAAGPRSDGAASPSSPALQGGATPPPATDHPGDFEGYVVRRQAGGGTPSAPATDPGSLIAAEAERQVGKPYVWATAGPNAFDCSGLVAWCVKRAVGMDISRDSHAQFALGTAVPQDKLLPGDVLFFDTQNGTEVRLGNRASHSGIYVRPGRMINALNEQAGVVASDPFSPYFRPLFLGARRLVAAPTPAPNPVPVPAPAPATNPVTPDTPFRQTGDTDLPAFRSAMARSVSGSSPMRAEADGIYASAHRYGLSRLCAAVAWMETKNHTWPQTPIPQSTHNAWAMTGQGPAGSVGRWAAFHSYAEATDSWCQRLLSENGPYAKARSVRDLVNIYAPASDGNDPDRYVRTIVDEMNALPLLPGTPGPDPVPPAPSPAPGLDFGPHPWPNGFDVRPLDLAPNGRGWDDLGDRSRPGVMVGTVRHHTAGNDDRDGVYDLFNRGGGRWGQAATEAVVDKRGLGYLMVDPWGSGRRVCPWASGTATALKGIGVPFVQQLGANAVNFRNFAAEHCNKGGEGFTDAQLDLSAKIFAVVIGREEIPWDQWPNNPKVFLRVDFDHERFAPTECPGPDWPWGGGLHQAWVQAVAHEAKVLQTGSAPPAPVPIPEPPPPPSPFPLGFTEERVAAFWNAAGGLKRRLATGTKVYPFDAKGPLSAMWLARCRGEGRFPAALEWWTDPSGWQFVSFGSTGDVDWLLAVPSLDTRADWRWVDRPPEG